ncbi:DNA-binding protein [Sediminispirochaeta smaragdinae DSM 11293]|uniref:DNA-binding protein n=2 Tax=Sediminispirochaeta TaxID=1911556 RepID=E1R1E9_SEDSS|nr:DNA-binding protein [Sediminispirochaeta smaragdinae DSM 11293]
MRHLTTFLDDNRCMGFWDIVKKEIKRQNTTQEWVSNHSNISFETFRGWIARKRLPRVDDGVRIAQSLDTTVEYLVTGKNPDNWQPPKRYANIVADLEMLDEKDLETVKALTSSLADRSIQSIKREA